MNNPEDGGVVAAETCDEGHGPVHAHAEGDREAEGSLRSINVVPDEIYAMCRAGHGVLDVSIQSRSPP